MVDALALSDLSPLSRECFRQQEYVFDLAVERGGSVRHRQQARLAQQAVLHLHSGLATDGALLALAQLHLREVLGSVHCHG